jgi:KDO2-lipid IV(A) lauroyltransferase
VWARRYTLGAYLTQWLSLWLPAATAFWCAERVADHHWRRSATDRQAVQTNLTILLGGAAVRDGMVREVFRNFARYLVEFLSMHRHLTPRLEVDGEEHLLRARRAQRGVILLTAHVGNWELGAALIRRMGVPLVVVALPHEDPWMDALFNRQRSRCGIEVIPLGQGAARDSLKRLRQGQVLGLLADRDFTGRHLRVPVGQGALRLPQGPALLSLRSEAPVVPTCVMRTGRWAFRLCFDPPIWPVPKAPMEAAVQRLTVQYAAACERCLRRVPEQWLMFQSIR